MMSSGHDILIPLLQLIIVWCLDSPPFPNATEADGTKDRMTNLMTNQWRILGLVLLDCPTAFVLMMVTILAK